MGKGEQKNKIVAIIPARGGSKGVPKKNIRPLAGYPLIAYSIAAGLLSKEIGRVVVSTDSEEIAHVSKKFAAEVPFLRPAELAGDSSPDIEFVSHALDWFEQNERGLPELIVHLRPTTPLRDPRIVDKAIALLTQKAEATSLRSGYPAPESPFKWFLKDQAGYFTGILPEHSNEYLNKPRQAFPDVYVPDGYVDVIRTSFVRDKGILHGEKMIGFVSPVCQEVDTEEDLQRLEYEVLRQQSPLLDYLKDKFSGGR